MKIPNSMKWINVSDKTPSHMQVVKVFIDSPIYHAIKEQNPEIEDTYPFMPPYERLKPAVFLKFSLPGGFYDAEEQIHLHYVTKWRPLDGMD